MKAMPDVLTTAPQLHSPIDPPLDPSRIEATNSEPTDESYNQPSGDGSLIDRPDVIRAVATILVLINLVSLVGFWRLHAREKDETLQGPLRFITDVNSAPASELSLLPGIGYELANRLVEYRETNGPYQSLDDLNRVRGIGPKTLAQIEPMVVFGPVSNQSITPPEPDPLVSASPAASHRGF
jgi:competence ComEA-like helix-hairpin-helix protein